MAIDIDFSDSSTVRVMIKEVQDSERERRQAVRDAKLFITKRDGQWDPYIWQELDGQYRGTFDMCTPIVDGISGEIDQSDFSLRVSPSGGDSSIDIAKLYDGIIRNIRNVSNADHVFSQASRSNVIGGFDAWEVVQDWVDGDSFEQELLIKLIPNAVDSVWFDLASTMQDRSDANWAIKLVKIPAATYRKKWPKGTGHSIGDDRRSQSSWDKMDSVTVGQLYYKKTIEIELVMMTDGSVYKVDDDFKKVQDELASPVDAQGQPKEPVTIELDNKGEEKRRKRDSFVVYSRILDGADWLQPEEETVFSHIPIVPIYGNFDIFENKSIYYGKIENLYDPQRVLNYAMSRDIQNGALSPNPAIWMTPEQAEGFDYSSMNTDGDPVRLYNHVENQPFQPSEIGGPQVNPGLQVTIGMTKEMIGASSGTFNAQQGNALAAQSGIAGAQQIDQGNIGSIKWFEALKVAVCQTGKILINAIPKVKDGAAQLRVIEEDGTSKMVSVNKKVFDANTQTISILNDLSQGDYDVVCDFGPAFNSQQKETQEAFLSMAAIDPSFLQKGQDIMLNNMAIPGMDQMRERVRIELLNSGIIPESQWTDEERQKIEAEQAQAAQQEQQPDPNMLIAQAEMQKAQAEQMNAQNKQVEIQGSQQVQMAKIQLENKVIDLDTEKFQLAKQDKFNVDAANIQQGQEKIDLAAQKQAFDQQMAIMKQQVDEMTAAVNNMKTIREAAGVDVIMGPGIVENFKNQSDIVSDEQDDIE